MYSVDGTPSRSPLLSQGTHPPGLLLVSSGSQMPPLKGNWVSHGEHPHPEMPKTCSSTTTRISCSQGRILGIPSGPTGKNSTCNGGDASLISRSGRFPGREHGNPLQYACLENSTDRGAWWAIVQRVARSQTRLKWLNTHKDRFSPCRTILWYHLCSRAYHGIRLS